MSNAASHAEPIPRFLDVLARAARDAPFDHTAACLATAGPDGVPSARIVLVRGADRSGLTFFTNYDSRKGRELAANPVASLCFYWPWIDEQVLVQGRVVRVEPHQSDAYFAGRPRGSQIGAWASKQSQPLASRAELEERYREIEREYEGRDIRRPPNWGGFRIQPDRVEFWKAGTYRLHDRELYVRSGDSWTLTRLFP